MAKFVIEMDGELVVGMRNGASVTVDVAKCEQVLADLLAYGIGQKVRDAASAASTRAAETNEPVETVALGMMTDAVNALYEGVWSHRGSGEGVDPRVAVARSIVRRAIKEKVGSKSPDWAKFTGLSDKDQIAKLDETFAANEALFSPLVDEEIARRAKLAKEKSKAAKAIEINL